MSEVAHSAMCAGPYTRSPWFAVASGWRVARSILRLFAQLNEAYPARDRASDGTIGDPAHCPGVSDHCPADYPGWGTDIVTAGDYDHDPTHGADMGQISEALRLSRDARIAYVIHNGRIFSSTVSPWTWRTYTGTNPHTGHMHLSVVHNSLADSEADWSFTMPLTSDDIKKVAAAVHTAVFTQPFHADGNTLGGSVKALLNYHPLVMAELKAIRDDPDNTFNPTDAELQLVADRLAAKLPSEGTFKLTPKEGTPA